MRRLFVAAAAGITLMAGTAGLAQTVYPIDRAEMLVGARFDFKVEFPEHVPSDRIKVTLNGVPHAEILGKAGVYVEREDGKDQSALLIRDVSLSKPGIYKVAVSDGTRSRELTWTVFETGPRRAKNVILFIGDGMSGAHRVAARLLAKGMAEGKTLGKLAIDDLPQMALVATAGMDSIIADSTNSASAYATGHKTAAGAMGVYPDRTADPFDDPRVENITGLVKRRLGLAVGIVTNTEIADATPAAMVAHTRRRNTYDRIVEQLFAAKPEVILGGGAASFLPKGAPGSKRGDDIDFIAKFRNDGYGNVVTAAELKAAAEEATTTKLLALFHPGNMDGALDRMFLKGGTVNRFPDQPDLTEQVAAALTVLSRNPKGFFLMVESGMIDKYTHALDMERAVYDTIMLDNAVRLARDWAADRGNDTLIMVLADHSHSISLIGTIEDDMATAPTASLRERVRIYERAGFPNYPVPDTKGYPDPVDVSRRLAIFSANLTDQDETLRPRLDNPSISPTPGAQTGTFEANEQYRAAQGSVLRLRSLPRFVRSSVHSAEDVILTAEGPGSERVRGQLDNTDVFRIMVEALGLGHGN
jgi:alkaline phosphatase